MSETRKQQLLSISLFLVAFTIPTLFVVNSMAIIVLLFVWLFQADFKLTYHNLKTNRILLVWILFYLLHVAGFFYSDNRHQAAFDLQMKLCLLIMPIILGAGITISRRMLETIFLGFISGITAAAIFSISKATILYFRDHDAGVFFYHSLVKGLNANAVYVAWYVIFSLSLLFIFKWQHFFTGKMLWLKYLTITIQFCFFILLSSKMLLVLFFLILVPFFYIRFYRTTKHSYFFRVAPLLVVAGLVAAILLTQNPIRERYSEMLAKDRNVSWKVGNDIEGHLNNLSLRVFLWKTGVKAINENNLWLFGCGNGDENTIINEALYKNGIVNIYDTENRSALFNVNLHNMFLQILLMLGISGLIVFLLIIISPFFALSYLRKEPVFFIFQLVSLLFMLQEAALQTQAGIVYFTFFSQILWNMYNQNKYSKSEIQNISLKLENN